MALCVEVIGQALQVVSNPEIYGCPFILYSQADSLNFDPASLDQIRLFGAFSAGFTIVGICWAMGKGAAVLLRMIAK